MEISEGDYLFSLFCDREGYPKTYEDLKQRMNTEDSELLDAEWERIGEHYESEAKNKCLHSKEK